MSADLTEKARVVLRAAEAVHDGVIDFDGASVVHDLVQVIVGRDPGEFWTDLLDALAQRDSVEDRIAPQYRPAELELANAEIAKALWSVLHGTRLYCQVCIDSRPGEPHEVAAATLPVWGELRRGRGRACEPHCREDWARAVAS